MNISDIQKIKPSRFHRYASIFFAILVLLNLLADTSDYGFPGPPWHVPYVMLLFSTPVWALPYTIHRTPRGSINPALWQYVGSFVVRWAVVTAIHVAFILGLPLCVLFVSHLMYTK